uniref:Uncharacterized protein n=1 Tax=Anguilla anguilla TaxID=7936 RepID=A0A0E9RSV4_ANGAN
MRDTKTGTSRIFRNVPHYTDFNIMHNLESISQIFCFSVQVPTLSDLTDFLYIYQ